MKRDGGICCRLQWNLALSKLSGLDKEGKDAVGSAAGAYFTVEPGGARYWSLRVVLGKRRREIGLGGDPTVPLALALVSA